MAKKRVEHVAKVPADKQESVRQYVADNDANAIKLRCCEQRYQTAVLAGEDDKAIKEHRSKIELNGAVRKSQYRLWAFVRSILPEVPEPTKETEHSVDVVGECDVKWNTYEEIPAEPVQQEQKAVAPAPKPTNSLREREAAMAQG